MAMLKIPQNLIFVSGMHGTGKTTLIRNTMMDQTTNVGPPHIIQYTKCEMTSFRINFERQPRRIAKYMIDFYRAIKLAVQNPKAIVITDRCYWDAYAYINAFHKLGYFTNYEFGWLNHILQVSFEPWDMTDVNVFLLHPPYEEIQKHLAVRQEKEVKWNETNEKYHKAVYDEYSAISENQPIRFYICSVSNGEKIMKIFKGYLITKWGAITEESVREMKMYPECFHSFLKYTGPMGLPKEETK